MRRILGIGAAVVLGTALFVGGCGDDTAEKPSVRIGILSPTSGALSEVGQSFVRVATAAVEEINDKGGANGHEIVLIRIDTRTDPEEAKKAFADAVNIDHVVAIIGPATSGAVASCYPEAMQLKVPHISPSSTAPSLGDPNVTMDGGWMFRNVPDDSIQGLAQAYYLRIAGPKISTAAIIHENGPYGEGLAASFETAFETAGGDVPDTHIISYDQNLPDQAAADTVWAQVMALDPRPTTIMMVALEGDALMIVNAWDNGGSPQIPNLRWFLTDGARSTGFLESMPASMLGAQGTAPTFPSQGSAYQVLKTAYEKRYDDNISDQVFGANVWDATHLIAAAIAKQSHDTGPDSIGQEGLRDAITVVSRSPGQIFHAGQWQDMMAAIDSGSDVDYDGASGPNDFNENGEALGPYEVWEIISDGAGGYTFNQVLFLEANDIQNLLNGP